MAQSNTNAQIQLSAKKVTLATQNLQAAITRKALSRLRFLNS